MCNGLTCTEAEVAPPPQQVKAESMKQEELRRSAMRAVAALLAVPDMEKNPSMAEFANQIRSNADMASMYQSVRGGEGGASEGCGDASLTTEDTQLPAGG